MGKITFLELAKKVLREEEKPLTPEEIWEIAQEKGYASQVGSEGKTPWRSIQAQIYVNIRDDEDSSFVKIESKPKKFFLKNLVEEKNLKALVEKEEKIVDEPKGTKYTERDLHHWLTYYADRYLGANTKTIKHERSTKKKFAQWQHPDIVGVHFPIDEWNDEVIEFGMNYVRGNLIKIYSFELKKELTFSNLRESFFQAVSNSSWANEGYLVVSKVLPDEEFRTELKRLSTSFGIGVIELDIDDPDSSDILFPAQSRNELDWDTVNKLSDLNSDFKKFISRMNKDLKTKEVRKEKYDKVLGSDELMDKTKEWK